MALISGKRWRLSAAFLNAKPWPAGLSLPKQWALNHLSVEVEPLPKPAPPGTHQGVLNTQYNQHTICSLRNVKKWTDNPECPLFVVWGLPIMILGRKKKREKKRKESLILSQ